jgi:REase_DpnII-MboI
MSSGEFATKVVIERSILPGAERDDMPQRFATVYVDGDEYTVLAPPKAIGDAIDWLDHCLVCTPSADTPGADEAAEASYAVYVIKHVKEELERRQQKSRAKHSDLNLAEAYYHVILAVANESEREVRFDLQFAKLNEIFVAPYRNGSPIWINGRAVPTEALQRIQVFSTPYPSSEFKQDWTKFIAKNGNPEWYASEQNVRDVTDEFFTSRVINDASSLSGKVELLCFRFPIVALQLRERHGDRTPLTMTDEYDVQDLFHALLRIFFDDVRPEEVTPSYAGKSARMDFLLPVERTVLEVKKTRAALGKAEVGSQLIEDIARYKQHPGCKRLICFVYDPENRIQNPRGLEGDLSKMHDGLDVKVIISSQR